MRRRKERVSREEEDFSRRREGAKMKVTKCSVFFVSLNITLFVMNAPRDIVKQLKPQYFWDVNLVKLNDIEATRLIIERVITLGTLKEIYLLIDKFGKKEMARIICNINYLDPKTCNFFSKLFNLSKRNFRCYTRKQLSPQHWNS